MAKTKATAWTQRELATLDDCLAVGMSAIEIAADHIPSRTVDAVEARIRFQRDKEQRRNFVPPVKPVREIVDREPCPRCAVRRDIGCAHTRAEEAVIARRMAKIRRCVEMPEPHPRAIITPRPDPVPPRPQPEITQQVNVRMTDAMFRTLTARATCEGVTASKLAQMLMVQALTAPDEPSSVAPNISPDVLSAWQEDGRPFGQFLSDMLELGVAEMRRFRGSKAA